MRKYGMLLSFWEPRFMNVRFIVVNGKPYALGRDITRVLEYSRGDKTLKYHCQNIQRCFVKLKWQVAPENVDYTNSVLFVDLIELSDVYKLLNHSRKPLAQEMKDWIFQDILSDLFECNVHKADYFANIKVFALM